MATTTGASENTVLHGIPYVHGRVSATLLAADLELSFWGGVNPQTGEVIDRFHPLSGRLLKDTVLAIPSGRGSCGGSIVMMELILNGLGPRAFIFERREEIITLGVFVADELFQKTVPVVTVGHDNFRKVLNWDKKMVHIVGGQISLSPLNQDLEEQDEGYTQSHLELTDSDREMLEGAHGEAAKVALNIIVRQARLMEARALMNVSQAHVDGAWYGPASVAFGTRLRDWGGKFKVPTTLNSLTVDQRKWRALGIDANYGSEVEELTKAFTDMGGTISFTCAPYLLDSVPKMGDRIAWGESNAVMYANSVLGARTLKNPNMLECLIALTGRAPEAGAYLEANRLAEMLIKLKAPIFIDDSYWPMLGYSLGAVAANRVPVVTGLEDLEPSADDLKAFAAAFATASSAPMFHLAGITPESTNVDAVTSKAKEIDCVDFGIDRLEACWDEFNHGSEPRRVDLISLGNPHFSFREIKRVRELCEGRAKHPRVEIIITCGRAQYGLAAQAGHVSELEEFGVKFLTDTCWCSIEAPIIQQKTEVIMTNSGKYIHYGPGLTGKNFCFGSLGMCVEAACTGRSTGAPPKWLNEARLLHKI